MTSTNNSHPTAFTSKPPESTPSQLSEPHSMIRDRSYSVHYEGDGVPALDPSTARVFPIRSVVSATTLAKSPTQEDSQARKYNLIDEQTSQALHAETAQPDHSRQSESLTGSPECARPEIHGIYDQTELATHSGANRVVQNPETYALPKSENACDDHITSRFEHKETDTGHGVTTGRNGKGFQYCEDEPIRTPGTVQSFGVMVVLREESPNQLVVRMVSENVEQYLGYTPKQLLAIPDFCDILDVEEADSLLDHLDFVRNDAYDPSVDGPDVFALSISTPLDEIRRFWCAIHVSQSQKDLIVCELELENDDLNPLNAEEDVTPATPIDTMGTFPTVEQFAASTTTISQPLRTLRNARRRTDNTAVTEVFNVLAQIQQQLGQTSSLDALLDTTSGLVKELTGFHRVLIYQFDSSWNGLVVSELADPKISIDLFKGLHFPASDIPAQARELYRVNKVRLLYDRDQVTSRLVCRTFEDLETPLDMTHAYLRAMSPVHIKYLANMQVRSSMSISINAFNGLWGLISCHSYGTAGTRVSFPIRKMCRLLGDAVSQNIERLSYTSRLQARKLINTVPTKANPSGYIVASSDDLLQLFDADYGVLCIHDETKIFGNGDGSSQEILALVEFLRIRKLNAGFASHDLIKDFPDFQYGTGLKTIAGLLFVPLSTGGNDFICLFRKGHLTEIKWAGNPYEIKKKKQTAGYLEPRNSFATWRETVLTQSREWSDSDIETAAVLCLVYGKFIKIWREKEAAMEKSHFSRLLMANSAHEARTPLNAIVNYLEIALEGSLDTETRDSLAKSHSASKSLIYVINDLLDLTQTEKGLDLIKDESFNLQTTLKEAVDMMAGEAKRKNIALTVTVDPEVPHQVLGDQRRVRQMFSNIISNAVQHTNSGAITVEMWRSTTQQSMEDHIAVDTLIVDTGLGMSNSQLEVLFQELEQVSTHEYHSPEDEQGPDSRDNEYKPVLGLGLAMVARVVNNMHGQLAVQSEEGKGSQFKLMLPFKLPEGVSVAAPFHGELPIPANSLASPPVSSPQFVLKGETRDGERDERCRSTDSLHSASSARSRRSHADRLIHAIQDPAHSQLTHGHSDMTHGTQSTKLLNSHYPSTSVASPSSSLARSASMQSHSNGLSTVKHAPPPRLQPFRTSSAPGTENITHSGVPLSAIRLSKQSINEQNQAAEQSSYFSPMPTPKSEISGPLMTGPSLTAPTSAPPAKPRCLHVLVAEDDPINSKIIEKRLTKVGHTVELTSNGEACATTFKANNLAFDVVLMDIQMPIADGYASTAMIRDFEAKLRANVPDDEAGGHVPIFAVSASLLESEKDRYIQAGFNGWVMKPINFARLDVLFGGVVDSNNKREARYIPGQWELGGWFD